MENPSNDGVWTDEEWKEELEYIDRRAAELGGYDELAMEELGVTRERWQEIQKRIRSRFEQKLQEWRMFNQLRDDLSRVGLSFVEYENVGEVGGWRGWVESPQGVVAFVAADGETVWKW
jgi:hypothetical protein